jgi:hypothetical protein
MRAADLQPLVDASDDAALLRGIDQLCDLTAWGELVDLAGRCDDAVELGRQLWAVRQHIEYRLALEAPPAWAGPVVRPGAARFALGPLTEVVAERFAWAEIAAHIDDPVAAAIVGSERVARGEDLRGEPVGEHADLPLWLAPFEPTAYPRVAYRDRQAWFPSPERPPIAQAEPVAIEEPGQGRPGDAAVAALTETTDAWSPGRLGGLTAGQRIRWWRADADAPTAAGAIAGLAHARPVRAATCTPGEAMAWLQWAGAAGGALGRRRGGAAGRFLAWSVLAAVAGLEWPPVVDDDAVADLGEAAEELVWWRWWRDDEPEAGWVLRLAVADPVDNEAYAIEACDPPPDDERVEPVSIEQQLPPD